MKSSELNKIMRLLNFPDRFKKKGRLAYYTLTHMSVKFLSSWVISKQIVDTVNKKSVSLPTNAPMPYIVHNNTIYYPYEHNLLVFGFKNKTKFRTIKMK